MADNGYWRATQRLTFTLLLVWVFITFGLAWFSQGLNSVTLLGFPLGFYMSAQGSLLLYLLLIWFYNRRMRQLEEQFGIQDE